MWQLDQPFTVGAFCLKYKFRVKIVCVKLALYTLKWEQKFRGASKHLETKKQVSDTEGRGSILSHASGHKTVWACVSMRQWSYSRLVTANYNILLQLWVLYVNFVLANSNQTSKLVTRGYNYKNFVGSYLGSDKKDITSLVLETFASSKMLPQCASIVSV